MICDYRMLGFYPHETGAVIDWRCARCGYIHRAFVSPPPREDWPQPRWYRWMLQLGLDKLPLAFTRLAFRRAAIARAKWLHAGFWRNAETVKARQCNAEVHD